MWQKRQTQGCTPGFWKENLKERDHWEDLDVVRRMILSECKRMNAGLWTGFVRMRGRRAVGSCGHGDEIWASIKDEE
jgi:hypothetical protein